MRDPNALYWRQYQVVIGTPRVPSQAIYGNSSLGASPLRVEFEILKDPKGTPNKGTVTVYNMAPDNRAAVVPGMLVSLSTGYYNAIQTLFTGIVAKVTSEKKNGDVATKMECGDGEAAIMMCRMDHNFARDTQLAQVFDTIATILSRPTSASPYGISRGTIIGIPVVTFRRGLTIHGALRRTLTKLCHPYGLEWSIQNNALQIIPLNLSSNETAEVLNEHTGLIGVPSYDGKTLNFNALLNARLTVGRQVKIESDVVNGFFKIRGGKWQGDSHGQKWDCQLEATRVNNIVAADTT